MSNNNQNEDGKEKMAYKIAELEAKKHNDMKNMMRYLPNIKSYEESIINLSKDKIIDLYMNDYIKLYKLKKLYKKKTVESIDINKKNSLLENLCKKLELDINIYKTQLKKNEDIINKHETQIKTDFKKIEEEINATNEKSQNINNENKNLKIQLLKHHEDTKKYLSDYDRVKDNHQKQIDILKELSQEQNKIIGTLEKEKIQLAKELELEKQNSIQIIQQNDTQKQLIITLQNVCEKYNIQNSQYDEAVTKLKSDLEELLKTLKEKDKLIDAYKSHKMVINLQHQKEVNTYQEKIQKLKKLCELKLSSKQSKPTILTTEE